MAKKVDKWSTAIDIAEQIYVIIIAKDPAYSREDAQRDFDLYNYSVIDCACRIVDNRLRLEGKDEMLPWHV